MRKNFILEDAEPDDQKLAGEALSKNQIRLILAAWNNNSCH
jgi:hypothetical protein